MAGGSGMRRAGGDCLSMMVTSTANVREVQHSEAQFWWSEISGDWDGRLMATGWDRDLIRI